MKIINPKKLNVTKISKQIKDPARRTKKYVGESDASE